MTDPLVPSVPAIILHSLADRWTVYAESFRDKQEHYLLHGNSTMAQVSDITADAFEICREELRQIATKAEEEYRE